jgi:hypothetical protein
MRTTILMGVAVLRLHLHGIHKLAPSVRPTTDVHQLRPTHAVVGLVAVGLQDAIPFAQELERTLAPSPQAKVEHRLAPRLAVLP